MARRSSSSPKDKSTNTKAPKTNEKGEIISWNSNSPDGKALRTLFEGGLITDETAVKVKKAFPQFHPYSNRCLNSALTNERKRIEKEIDTQKARGSSGEFLLMSLSLGLLFPTSFAVEFKSYLCCSHCLASFFPLSQ